MSWGTDGLTVRYGDRVALDEVSMEVPAETVSAVVGGDGSGKTTLLRALVGLVRPAAGSVRRPSRRRLGYFSAATGVYPDLTVEENLDFAAAGYRVGAATSRRRRGELLEVAGLSGATRRLGGQLSGGMRQKLGVVMAMLHEPELLVLDEPSTGVDPVSRAELSSLLVRAAASGAAVLLSTAYLEEAERAAHVVVLDRGSVLTAGAPDALVASVPGVVVRVGERPRPPGRSWRRGAGWRQWVPPGERAPAGAQPAPVDLEDAVIVAALGRGA